MAIRTPILCRICKKKMGNVPNFEGRIFMLCPVCERALKAAKKRGISPASRKKS